MTRRGAWFLAALILAGCNGDVPTPSDDPPPTPTGSPSADRADLEPAVREKLAVAEQRARTTDDGPSWLHYARVLHAHRMYAEAVVAYDTARERGGTDAFEPLYLSGLCLKSSDPGAAKQRLREAAAVREDVPALHGHLADLHLAAGELDAAETHFQRLEDLAPGGPARLGLARVALARGKPARARVHLNAMRGNGPVGRGALEARARAEQALGNTDEARAAATAARNAGAEAPVPDPLLAAVMSEGVSFMNHMAFALTYERRREYDRALGRIEAALHVRPENPDALLLKAQLLRAAKRDGEAIDVYRHALACGADESEVRAELGAALVATGSTAEAVTELERALELDPDRVRARLTLARALARSRAGAALEHVTRVLQSAPGERSAQILFAELLMGAGRFEAGTAYLNAVNAEGATDADARAALDRALVK